jgi:hypothetical protein
MLLTGQTGNQNKKTRKTKETKKKPKTKTKCRDKTGGYLGNTHGAKRTPWIEFL